MAAAPIDAPTEAVFFKKMGLTLIDEFEGQFLIATSESRKRKFVTAIVFALVIYNLFIFYDAIVRPDILVEIINIRLLYTTVPCLLLTLGILKSNRIVFYEILAGAGILITALGISAITLKTKSGYAAADVMTFPLVLLVGNTILPFRFRSVLPVNMLAIIVFLSCLLLHETIPIESRRTAVVVLFATSFYTLFAVARNEKNERINFMHRLLEEERSNEILRINTALFNLSRTDSLTGLCNRRHFDEHLENTLKFIIDNEEEVGLIIFDVDRFKWYNDGFGHQMGDSCLRQIATAAHSVCCDSSRLLARIGGEEFAVVVKRPYSRDVISVAEQVRSAIAALSIPHPQNDPLGIVTISLGVAISSADHPMSSSGLLRAADGALYLAKNNGRNRIEVAKYRVKP